MPDTGQQVQHALHHKLCLLQNFPNAINTPAFPDSVLRPGHTYQNVCIWRFKTLPAANRLHRLLVGLAVLGAAASAVVVYMHYHKSARHRWQVLQHGKT